MTFGPSNLVLWILNLSTTSNRQPPVLTRIGTLVTNPPSLIWSGVSQGFYMTSNTTNLGQLCVILIQSPQTSPRFSLNAGYLPRVGTLRLAKGYLRSSTVYPLQRCKLGDHDAVPCPRKPLEVLKVTMPGWNFSELLGS